MTNQEQSTSPHGKPTETAKEEANTYSISAMFVELLFILLPFCVLFFVDMYQDMPPQDFLFAPEWSFASAILFGQAVVKLVQGSIETTPTFKVAAERVVLFVAVLIVLGLVPSMVILVLILVSTCPSDWLGWAQIILFILATSSFLLLGTVAHRLSCKARNHRNVDNNRGQNN